MNKTMDDEKRIIIKQYVALFTALFLFIPLSLLSLFLTNSTKWGLIAIFPLYFYIGISSVKNQVSILRAKGRIDYSRGKQAMLYGNLMVVGGLITVLIILIIPSHLFFAF